MTVTELNWIHINAAEDILVATGRLAIARWRVVHSLTEVGRGLGVDLMGTGVADACRVLTRTLDVQGPPVWAAPNVEVQIMQWLPVLKEWAEEADRATEASSTVKVGNNPARHWIADDNVAHSQIYDLGTFHTLMVAADQLVADTDRIQSALVMPRVGGGGQFGYREIAHSLYLHAIDPDPAPDVAPAPRQT